MKEVELQNEIVTYLDHTGILYTCTLGGVFLGRANWKQKRMIARHYKKGVPDVLIFEPSNNNKYNGLMVELKVKGNYPTKEQKDWIAKLNARDYKAVVCRSLAEFIEIIKAYFNEEI
tara:strand:+ start:366 stop:716 length:351 start_codon:yes stop_codon:yes gene_type:complete